MFKQILALALTTSFLAPSWLVAEEDRSAVLERIKPIGTVSVEGQMTVAPAKTLDAPVEQAAAVPAEPTPSAPVAAPAAEPAAATAAMPAATAAADGQAVYQTACFACHATGAAGAPKLGDKAAWAPRLPAGKQALLSSVLNGKGAMPPKGGQMQLSDAEVSAAVDYLISAAQ